MLQYRLDEIPPPPQKPPQGEWKPGDKQLEKKPQDENKEDKQQ